MGKLYEFFVGPKNIPDRTGTFTGHFLPGAFIASVPLFFLLLAVKRALELPPGKTFCQAHVPERSSVVLRRLGWYIVACTSTLAFQESWTWIISNGTYQAAKPHITMAFLTAICGVAALLESKKKLPADSFRRCLVVNMMAETVMMYGHASMKENMADAQMHKLLAHLYFAGVAATAYSIAVPSSLMAYVGSYAVGILAGVWWITIGFYMCCIEISHHDVGPLFGCEVGVLMAAVLAVVHFRGVYSDENEVIGPDGESIRAEFKPLDSSEPAEMI